MNQRNEGYLERAKQLFCRKEYKESIKWLSVLLKEEVAGSALMLRKNELTEPKLFQKRSKTYEAKRVGK